MCFYSYFADFVFERVSKVLIGFNRFSKVLGGLWRLFEGLSKNIKVNVLAPAAETRLIGTIPGVDVNPDNPSEERHPQLVTPSVLLMCDEDAPTGRVIHAGNGEFYSSAIFSNNHINLGKDVTYEELLEHKDRLLDMIVSNNNLTSKGY